MEQQGAPVGRAAAPDAGTSELRLRPPRHRVDPRAVRWWTAQAVALVVPPVVVLVVLGVLIGSARTWLLTIALIIAIVGAVYILMMPRWRYRVHRWETTDGAVYTAAGWLWQEWRVAPLSRIQTVDTVRGPLQQLFKLSGVTVTTASAAGAITIEGLDHELATRLVEELTQNTQATPGDAT